eukprot:3083-Heterococcus_DN1.PRE.2
MASEHTASAAGSSDASQQQQQPQPQQQQPLQQQQAQQSEPHQPQQRDDNSELFAAKLLRGEFPKNITLKHASEGTEFKSDGILKAIDSTRMGCWDLNITTGEIKWNKHMYTLFDKDQDEPMHFNDGLRRIHPDDVVSTAIAVECQ